MMKYFSTLTFCNTVMFPMMLIWFTIFYLNPAAKPGKVVGPGLAYDSGNREKYDPRSQVRNAVGPPQIMSSVYSYDRSGVVKQERSVETERDMNCHSKPMAPCGMAAKLAPDIAINIDSNPFYMMRAGVTKPDRVDD